MQVDFITKTIKLGLILSLFVLPISSFAVAEFEIYNSSLNYTLNDNNFGGIIIPSSAELLTAGKPDWWVLPSATTTALEFYPYRLDWAGDNGLSTSTSVYWGIVTYSNQQQIGCNSVSGTVEEWGIPREYESPVPVGPLFYGDNCNLASSTKYEVRLFETATDYMYVAGTVGTFSIDEYNGYSPVIVYGGEQPNSGFVSVPRIFDVFYPRNGLSTSTSVTFSFQYINPPASQFTHFGIRINNETNGALTTYEYAIPSNSYNPVTYTTTVVLTNNSLYSWQPYLFNITSSLEANVPLMYFTVGDVSTSSIDTFFGSSYNWFSYPDTTYLNDVSTYDITDSSFGRLMCDRFPFSYFCDVYDVLLNARDNYVNGATTTFLTFDMSSSTSALSTASDLPSRGIDSVSLISSASLQYFFPSDVASVFRSIVTAGLYLGFAYMVWSSIMGLIKIQT